MQKTRDLPTLVLMCGCALSVMLLTLAVVLPTPHDYSGTFKEGTVCQVYSLEGSQRLPKCMTIENLIWLV